MAEQPQHRKQWHPVIVEGLEYLLEPDLVIEAEHALAKLPLRVDVLLRKRDPHRSLPFPYSHLGDTTLLELETPGKWPNWRALCKLCVDGGLYRLAANQENPEGIALWLVVSRASARFADLLREELGAVEDLAPGLWQGKHLRSPVVVVHLHELPLSIEALPLLMVYRGPREPEIAEFALAHAEQYRLFLDQSAVFHPDALREVLAVKTAYAEAYRQLADVKGFIDLVGEERIIEQIGEEKIIEQIGEEKIIEQIGEEKIIEQIGEERVLRDLLHRLGPDRVREMLEREAGQARGNGQKDTP